VDWEFSAPCLTCLGGRSPGAIVEGRWHPRGSIVASDGGSIALEGKRHKRSEMPVADVALHIKELCARYGITPHGVADDAVGIRNRDGVSVVGSFATNGVYLREAGKGSRVGGWQHMRELLMTLASRIGLDSTSRIGVPISGRSRRLSYAQRRTWRTVMEVPLITDLMPCDIHALITGATSGIGSSRMNLFPEPPRIEYPDLECLCRASPVNVVCGRRIGARDGC
jgi:hypothetical protein